MMFDSHFFDLSELTPLPREEMKTDVRLRGVGVEKVCLCEEVGMGILGRGQPRGVMGACWERGVLF